MILRTKMLGRGAPLAAVLLLAAVRLAAAGPESRGEEDSSSTPWYVYYQKGLQAMVDDQWEEAATLFSRAIEKREPSPSPARTYGMWQVDYVPFYNLAVCSFYLGRDAEALRALERSESLGETPPDGSMHRKLQRIRRAIQGGPGAPEGSRDARSMVEGLSHLLSGGADRAVEVFQGLLAGREDDARIHLYLGLAYAGKAARATGDRARFWHGLARAELRRARRLGPRLELPDGLFADEIEALFEEAGAR